MSVRKVKKVLTETVSNHEFVIAYKYGDSTRWDDDWENTYWPTINYKIKGKNFKKREIFKWQVRMYKTWKHNRDHQWKN